MKRHNLVLIGALIVQIALSVTLLWPRTAAGGEGQSVFPDLDPGKIVAVTITDNEGNSLDLSSAAGEWVLPEAGDFPVRPESIDRLLKGLSELATGRLVTRTEPSHRSLQVADDEFARRILFKLADGSSRAIYLGSSPRYGVSHFRVFGESEVYLTSELQSWDAGTSASAWIDTIYVSVPRSDIVRLTLANANGTFVFTVEGSADEGAPGWSMDGLEPGERLSNANVNSMVNQVASINMVAPLGKEALARYGLGDPNAVVTIETADDTLSVVVGATDPQDRYYVVKASSSPYYVHVPKWNVSSLVENTREDFLELPPTPLPETEATPIAE